MKSRDREMPTPKPGAMRGRWPGRLLCMLSGGYFPDIPQEMPRRAGAGWIMGGRGATAGRWRRWLRRAWGVLSLAAVLLAPVFGAGLLSPAQAQTVTTLVSNTGQTVAGFHKLVGTSVTKKYSRAQRFTTGNNPDGYTLGSVRVFVYNFGGSDTARVRIYTATGSGHVDSSLYVLTNSSPIVSGALNTFTAPANSPLTKETKYFVVVEAAAGLFDVGATTSDAEDAGKASEWSIDNIERWRDSDTSNWGTAQSSLRMTVEGTVVNAAPTASNNTVTTTEDTDYAFRAADFNFSGTD